MKMNRTGAAIIAVLALAACSDEGTDDALGQRGPAGRENGAPGEPTAGQTGSGAGSQTGGGTGQGNGTGTGSGSTAVMNTFSKVWVDGNTMGPEKLGKLTGAGVMDSHFTYDRVAYQANPNEVLLGTVYTRSSNTRNNNNSYLQGGFALAKLTPTGLVLGAKVDLPQLNGDRTFMRPLIGFTPKYTVLIAASEDNGVNNNPQPVLYLANKTDGALMPIKNTTRGNNQQKPTNLIRTAVQQGIQVNNANNQRGPHTIVQVADNSFVVGMQYNNQAQEAFRVTVLDDGTVQMNWLQRYSNTAQHCRPSVAVAEGATTGFIAAVEANNQPAEIGFRITEFNVATGKSVQSKIAMRSSPKANKYVSEPVLGIIGDKLSVVYGLSQEARQRNGDNGHVSKATIDAAALFSMTDLSLIGEPLVGAGQFGRHSSAFVTSYGPNGEPALAVISGSSTGTGKGFEQIFPLKTDGTLGLKDALKTYVVAPYADVANVQARGKRNPNNQARGFINGLGSVPNPGYTTDSALAANRFMPEVRSFSFSTVTGYSDAAAAAKGQKNSLWLALVPASWAPGLQTLPGQATANPGTSNDGNGPAPRTTGQATNPSGDSAGGEERNVLAGTEGTSPNASNSSSPSESEGGCSVTHDRSHVAWMNGLLVAAALLAAGWRRRSARP